MKLRQICGAAAGAAAVNILIFMLLSAFRASAPLNADTAPDPVISLVRRYETEAFKQKPRIEEEVFREDEIMEIDLDLDSSVAVDLRPVEVDRTSGIQTGGPVIINGPAPENRPPSLFDSDVDVPPKEISCPLPRYPRTARRKGIEGTVTVKLRINTEGVVEKNLIVSVEGDELFGQAVAKIVPQWRFKPALHRGKPVTVWALKRIRFKIEE